MQYTVLLNYNEDTKSVELEEKNKFVRSIFEALDIDVSNIQGFFHLSTKEDKILQEILDHYKIDILDDNDGELEIFAENELIAKWYKCSYKLKQDLSQINPKKKIYLEMTIQFETIFDDKN